MQNFLNKEGHQNHNTGLKVTIILLEGLILPIGEIALERVYAYSLRSRLVFTNSLYQSFYPHMRMSVFHMRDLSSLQSHPQTHRMGS